MVFVFKAGLEDPGCYGNPGARPSLPSILGALVVITTSESTLLFPVVWRGGDPVKGCRATLLPRPEESLLPGNQKVKKVLRGSWGVSMMWRGDAAKYSSSAHPLQAV